MVSRTTAVPRNSILANGPATASSLWKLAVLLLVTLLLPFVVRAQDSLRIDGIGLGGYYSSIVPVPVVVHLPALSLSDSIRLEFTVRSSNAYGGRGIVRSDHFSKRVSLQAGQQAAVEVPIQFPQASWVVLDVAAIASDGRIVAQTTRDLKNLEFLVQNQSLIAVYCNDDAKCQSAESQVAFRDTEPGAVAQRVTAVRAPRRHWWSYSLARAIVLAGPLAGFTREERDALEDYARGGGTLVILEQDIADKDFLAPYRAGPVTMAAIPIGCGHIYRLRSLESKDLDQQSFNAAFSGFANFVANLAGQWSSQPLLNIVAISFTFPRLRWMIIWLAAYLLVVGPLNFFLLRRARKLEWGWLTTCLLALLFAASLYFSSSAHRPRNYTFDNATVYWMDSRSPVAVEDVAIRVSSPEHSDVAVSVQDDLLTIGARNALPDARSEVEIGADMTDKQRTQQGWDVDLGPPLTVVTAMLRWSTQDFQFEGFRKFGGAVHWSSTNSLRNDTGISFSQSAYFDFPANRRYLISNLVAGGEIDLAALPYTQIWKTVQLANGGIANLVPNSTRAAVKGTFSIEDLPYSGIQTGSASHVFAGLSDDPLPVVQLHVSAVPRAKALLTIVNMDEK